MRFGWIVVAVLGACDGGGKTPPDAAQDVLVHAPDAAIDAMPDATVVPMNIADACMHACDKVAMCANDPVETTCYGECAADLADCTAQQVMDVDACSQLACGTNGEAVGECIVAIACVDG